MIDIDRRFFDDWSPRRGGRARRPIPDYYEAEELHEPCLVTWEAALEEALPYVRADHPRFEFWNYVRVLSGRVRRSRPPVDRIERENHE